MADTITLNCDSPSVIYLCKKDKRLAKAISMVGEITYAPHTDGYEFLVHEIIEQMLSIKAGAKIFERLKDLCNGKITPENIANLTDAKIAEIGTSKSKVGYIRNLTDILLADENFLNDLATLSDKDVRKKLMSIKGIGNWTADMYLIFVLDRPDILPISDVAFLQSYEWLYKDKSRSKVAIEKKCQKWRPYSSVAARFLYRVLDMGLTKKEFHLFKP